MSPDPVAGQPEGAAASSGAPTADVPPADSAAVLALLVEWLPGQRWFAGGEAEAATVRIDRRIPVSQSPGLSVELVLLAVGSGEDAALYQLLLGWRTELPEWVEHVIIGAVHHMICYDALHDHDVTALLLDALAAGRSLGAVNVRPRPDVTIDPGLPGLVINAEQSNTSVVYGDQVIMKFYRRLTLGDHPDAEMLHALAGCPYTPPLLGELTTTVDGAETTLAVATEFFTNSADGWSMATASVRDLLAEGDLHADEVGGDFAAEAYRLGEAVAAVHRQLAQTLGTRHVTRPEVAAQVAAMTGGAEQLAAAVPSLAPHLDAIRATYTRLADEIAAAPDGPVIIHRIHGDLHLGQALRTVRGWVLIDFEGEPSRPVAERRSLRSPLQDVAGMLRSLHYAAHQLLAMGGADAQRAYRAAEWTGRNRTAFLDGYTATAEVDPRAQQPLLTAFELAKAVYEVGYEHAHRPAWEQIPLAAVAELTAATP